MMIAWTNTAHSTDDELIFWTGISFFSKWVRERERWQNKRKSELTAKHVLFPSYLHSDGIYIVSTCDIAGMVWQQRSSHHVDGDFVDFLYDEETRWEIIFGFSCVRVCGVVVDSWVVALSALHLGHAKFDGTDIATLDCCRHYRICNAQMCSGCEMRHTKRNVNLYNIQWCVCGCGCGKVALPSLYVCLTWSFFVHLDLTMFCVHSTEHVRIYVINWNSTRHTVCCGTYASHRWQTMPFFHTFANICI